MTAPELSGEAVVTGHRPTNQLSNSPATSLAHALPRRRLMMIKGYDVVPLVKKTVKEIGDGPHPFARGGDGVLLLLLALPAPALPHAAARPRRERAAADGLDARPALRHDARRTLSLVRRVLDEVITSSGNAGIMSIGVLLAGWSGSNIFGALMGALNIAYDVSETRPWWKKQLLRVGALLVAGRHHARRDRTSSSTASASRAGSARRSASAMRRSPPGRSLQIVLAVALLVALGRARLQAPAERAAEAGRTSSSRRRSRRCSGSSRRCSSACTSRTSAYNKTYGTIGGVIVLLTWMYYSMFVLLVGGELASELHHGSGATDADEGRGLSRPHRLGPGPGTPSISDSGAGCASASAASRGDGAHVTAPAAVPPRCHA